MSETPQTPQTPRKTLTPLNIVTAVALAAGAVYLMLSEQAQPPVGETTSAPPAALAPAKQGLFQLGGRVYDFASLPLDIQEPLFQIRKLAHQQQMLVLEQALVDSYLREESQRLQLSEEETLAQLLPDAEPSEEEMQTFYRQNQRADTPPFDKIKPEIHAYLMQSKRESLKKTLLTELLVSGKARLLLEAPTPPHSPTE